MRHTCCSKYISVYTLPLSLFFALHAAYAGDIEQILPADSNFTIDGSNNQEVMRVQSDGKVGIGTTTPNEVLEVNGRIRMTDGNEAANTVMIGDAQGTASWADISTLQNTLNTDDQQLQNFNLTNNILSITLEDGGTLDVNLSALNNTAAVATVQSDLDTHIANDGDTNASNELQDLTLTGTSLEIANGNAVDLGTTFATNTAVNALATTVANDADTDPANEVNTQLTLNGTTLEITDSAGTLSQDLNGTFATDAELATLAATVGNDGDTDAANELNTNVALNGTALEVTDAGGTKSVDLDGTFATDTEVSAAIVASAALDLDKDSTNEIQTLTSNDNTVSLTQNGNNYDLSVNIPAQTITTISNTIAGNKIADYTNESGTTVTINETVTSLAQQASPNQLDYQYTDESGTQTTLRSSPIVAFGKVSEAGALQRGYGATVVRNSAGNYTVTLDTARPTANYTIQLTILDSNGAGNDDYDIAYSNQTTGTFIVQTGDNDNGNNNRAQRDSEFMFTVIDY